MLYDQERTAGSFYNYASRRVPKAVSSLKKVDDVKDWVEKVCPKWEMKYRSCSFFFLTFLCKTEQSGVHPCTTVDERLQGSLVVESPRQQIFRHNDTVWRALRQGRESVWRAVCVSGRSR